jgi:hypothetical protein
MQPKDWFTTLAGQSITSFVAGIIALLLTLWYASTLPCIGQPDPAAWYALSDCAGLGYTEPTILGMPANLACVPIGAAVGAITFGIEKVVSSN